MYIYNDVYGPNASFANVRNAFQMWCLLIYNDLVKLMFISNVKIRFNSIQIYSYIAFYTVLLLQTSFIGRKTKQTKSKKKVEYNTVQDGIIELIVKTILISQCYWKFQSPELI